MKELGIESSDLSSFLTNVYKVTKRKGISVESLSDKSHELISFEEKYGEFGKVKTEWEESSRALPQLESELKEKKKQKDESVKDYQNLFTQMEVDKATLDEYKRNKDLLSKLGFDITRLSELVNLFTTIKANNFDPTNLIAKFNSITDLEQNLENLHQEREQTSSRLSKIDLELKSKSVLVEEARNLAESGLSPDQVRKIRDAIVRVSSNNAIDPSQATQKFEAGILDN